MVLDALHKFEQEHGTPDSTAAIAARLPKTVKKRRRIMDPNAPEEEAVAIGWEEYYDYIFPDDETEKPSLKLLAMAHQWKQRAKQ
jgi:crooked neck